MVAIYEMANIGGRKVSSSSLYVDDYRSYLQRIPEKIHCKIRIVMRNEGGERCTTYIVLKCGK